MLNADYIVRGNSGVPEEGKVSFQNDIATLPVGSSHEISLNISKREVARFLRRGDDLELVLTNGQVILLSGYFADGAGEKSLFLSEFGAMDQVFLTDLGDGTMAPVYSPIEIGDKWHAQADLAFGEFDRVEPLITPVSGPNSAYGVSSAGGLGLVSMAAGAGGLGLAATALGASGAYVPAAPVVDNIHNVIRVGQGDSIPVTGSGEPGTTVTVTVGDVVKETEIGDDGTWAVSFAPEDIPADGKYTVDVVFTLEDGSLVHAGGPGVIIDTTAPEIEPSAGLQSTGDIINAANHADGTEISGYGEPGATVDVTINGHTISTTVGLSGQWSVSFDASQVPGGEYQLPVSITTTDSFGNASTITDTLLIDTIAPDLSINAVAGDNVLSGAEASGPFAISGTAEPGATITVEIDGQTLSTIAGSTGAWTLNFDGTAITPGEYDATITATATDAAGNPTTLTQSIHIDTLGSVSIISDAIAGDGVLSGAEAAAGLTLTGTAEPGSTVTVSVAGVEMPASVAPDGSWSVTFPAGSIPGGQYEAPILATATDAYGNTSVAQSTLTVDTEATLTRSGDDFGPDGVINAAEHGAGITLTGMSEPGSTVIVTLEGVTRAADVAPDGSWSVSFAPTEIPTGEYDAAFSAEATDAYGNTSTLTDTIRVDTEAGTVAFADTPIETDGTINYAESTDGVTLYGTATPLAEVVVAFDGATRTVTSDTSGNWSADFNAASIAPGTYDAPISATITDAAGNSASVSDTVHVDTAVMGLTITAAPIAINGVISGAEADAGVTITGTTEAGSAVTVKLGHASRAATVTGTTWSVTFDAADIPEGQYQSSITATATDAAGNTATTSDQVYVDTIVDPLTSAAPTEASAADLAAGLTLTGTSEIGSSVEITIGGVTRAASVNGAGDWSVTFAAGEIANGEYEATASITAVDAQGNTRTITDSFTVDTAADVPLVTAYSKGGTGVRGVSVADTNDDLSVYELTEANGQAEVGFSTDEIEAFNELQLTFTRAIPDGSNLVIASEDAAGNSSGTLFALENPDATSPEVNIDHAGLAGLQINAIDLQFDTAATLTIDAADIARLTGSNGDMTIHGGADDYLTLEGATLTTEAQAEINGNQYDVYTIGEDGTKIYVDETINVT